MVKVLPSIVTPFVVRSGFEGVPLWAGLGLEEPVERRFLVLLAGLPLAPTHVAFADG